MDQPGTNYSSYISDASWVPVIGILKMLSRLETVSNHTFTVWSQSRSELIGNGYGIMPLIFGPNLAKIHITWPKNLHITFSAWWCDDWIFSWLLL